MALYHLPSPLLFVIALATAVAAIWLLVQLVRRYFHPSDLERHNQIGGSIVAIAGTLYAVVLGFLTVVVWQQYQGAADRVSTEAAAAADAWHTSVGLPAPLRSRIRDDVVAYADDMIAHEWPLMRNGGFSTEGDRLIMEMTADAGTYVPRNSGESAAQSATLQSLVTMHDERLRRLSANAAGMTWLEWSVLGIGAAVVIAFCLIFAMQSARTHFVMTSALTVVIVSMIFMIFELQYPFRGDLGIAPSAWTGLIAHIHYMQTASPRDMRM